MDMGGEWNESRTLLLEANIIGFVEIDNTFLADLDRDGNNSASEMKYRECDAHR